MTVEVVKQDEKLARIALSDIQANDEALRGVNKTDVDYIELAGSIASRGVLIPIRVREVVDTEANTRYFSLIDGLQRFTAAGDAGFADINAIVVSSTDEEVLEEQMITNLFRVETKLVEYTQQLRRILRNDPSMTISKLAAKIKKSDSWLKQRLQLTKLCPEAAELVDGGHINLNNAYGLSTLPAENQPELFDAAMNKTFTEFAPIVDARRKELTKARRAGGSDTPAEFVAKQAPRKAGDILEEIKSAKAASLVIPASGASTAAEGFKAGLEWALSLDALSVAEQRQKYDEAQQASAAKKAAMKQERESKNNKAGEVKAARMALQLQLQEEKKTPDEIRTALYNFDTEHNVAPPTVKPKKADEPAAPATDAPAVTA